MSGHQPFSNLTANFSPQRKAKITQKTQQLREVINAMGGELDITARFGDREIKITNFDFLNSDRNL